MCRSGKRSLVIRVIGLDRGPASSERLVQPDWVRDNLALTRGLGVFCAQQVSGSGNAEVQYHDGLQRMWTHEPRPRPVLREVRSRGRDSIRTSCDPHSGIPMTEFTLDPVRVLSLSIVVLWLGKFMERRLPFLSGTVRGQSWIQPSALNRL